MKPNNYRSLPRVAQAGFSLIEILIVVGIIAIIAGVVANAVIGGGDKAKFKLAQGQIEMLSAKIESYELDNGSVPAQLQDLVTQPGNAPSWLGPYAKEKEIKDPWNHDFEYRAPGQNGKFDLVSLGADGKPGGESYDKDITDSE